VGSLTSVLLLLAQTGASAQPRQTGGVVLKVGASGAWCDGRILLAVELQNHGVGPLYIGLPSATNSTWPFPYDLYVQQARTISAKGGEVCGCSDSDNGCELCAEPAVVVELAPAMSRTWQLLAKGNDLRVGRLEVQVVLRWYGSRARKGARRHVMRANSTIVTTLRRTTGRCFQPTEIREHAGR
jgi:hypothetical protein